jgi:photosynthetic reaction center cytochrome c subunit
MLRGHIHQKGEHMNGRWKGSILAIAGLAMGVALIFTGTRAQSAPAQASGTEAEPKTAAQAFKNIQVLKDIPADELFPTMEFISASLGVECGYCHVQHAFDKDDKPTKRTARKMMLMMFAINKDSFEGRREVTCYSCHRGAAKPTGVPVIADHEPEMNRPPAAAAGGPAASLPTADQILDKYVQAVGGAEAIEKITSRTEKGTLTGFGGSRFPIEVYAKAPNLRMSVMHTPHGDSITAYDGQRGWLSGMGRPRHEVTGPELQPMRLNADFRFPADAKEVFTQFRLLPPEKLGDQSAYVVMGFIRGEPAAKMYFDEQSGLLLRLVQFTQTALGLLPAQIDYADYREADGVKVPFRWTLARTRGRFTIQVDELRQNVPIDDARFVPPAGRGASEGKRPTP